MSEQAEPFELRITAAGSRWTIYFAGELDASRAPDIAQAAQAVRDCHLRDVVLDLGSVTFADCAGYRAILAACERLEDGGAQVRIASEGPAVARIHAVWDSVRRANLAAA